MVNLPPIPQLIQRTKALAALDLIMSPEWDSRYYSFNRAWSHAEQMASMRDGCGDEWWIVFHSDGWAALKGLGHESAAWSKSYEKLSFAIQKVFPAELYQFAHEPAFRWDATSFAYFWLPSKGKWTSALAATDYANQECGDTELLEHLVGGPADYVHFASTYYEKTIPVEMVRHIFGLRPITEMVVAALNDETRLPEIESELYDEIGYPKLLDGCQ